MRARIPVFLAFSFLLAAAGQAQTLVMDKLEHKSLASAKKEVGFSYDEFSITSYANILNHHPAYGTRFTIRENPTGFVSYKNATEWITSTTEYDIAGNAVKATDARNNIASTIFLL